MHLDSPPISLRKVQGAVIMLISINFLCIVASFAVLIIKESLTSALAGVTAATSILNGTAFALSSALLYEYIRRSQETDFKTLNMVTKFVGIHISNSVILKVKYGRIIGFCAVYRCIMDITFLMPFSGKWKSESQREHNLFWPLFMLVYFIMSDILPSFLFLKAFTLNNPTSNSGREATLNQSLLDRHLDSEAVPNIENLNLISNNVEDLSLSRINGEQDACLRVLDHSGLLDKNNTVPGSKLKEYKVVALLFAAQWCPPCREFISKFESIYNEVNCHTKELEVVFISGDYDEVAFQEYYGPMPWVAMPYEDPTREAVIDELEIGGIPEVFIVDKDSKIVTRSARADIEKMGAKAFHKWVSLLS